MPRRKKSESRQALEFAVILAVLGALFAILALWRHHPGRAYAFGGGGLVVLGVALLARPLWVRAFRLWMKLAEAMGWVTTRIVLTVFYYLVLTPFGLARRLTGRPPLDTKWPDDKGSYWIDKEPVEASIERYAKRY